MNNGIRILAVEDEEDILDILELNLTKAGFTVDTALSGEQALDKDLSKYDLFILDIMLGDVSGLDIARRIRENEASASTPFVFLTSLGSEQDKLEGFSLGADDYITKPFSVKVLTAKINAILKRTAVNIPGQVFELSHGYLFNREKMSIICEGIEAVLTRKEFLLLDYLTSNPGRVVSRATILDTVWKDEGTVTDRAVDVMVTRLRKKMGPSGRRIRSRSGLGYIFE